MNMSLLQLPNELVGEILYFLNDKDRFERFGIVNKQSNALAYSSPLPFVSLASGGVFGEKISTFLDRASFDLSSSPSEEFKKKYVGRFRSFLDSLPFFSRLNLG
jgi:hypothetical protein